MKSATGPTPLERGLRVPVLLLALTLPAATVAADTLYLITEEEAALAEPKLRGATRELDDGPRIRIESPQHNGTYQGPFPVRVFFQKGSSGLPVNLRSLRLIYKKLWGIDITSRVRDYLKGNAILAPEAELPKGRHTVEIYIEDIEENPSSRLFTVTVK